MAPLTFIKNKKKKHIAQKKKKKTGLWHYFFLNEEGGYNNVWAKKLTSNWYRSKQPVGDKMQQRGRDSQLHRWSRKIMLDSNLEGICFCSSRMKWTRWKIPGENRKGNSTSFTPRHYAPRQYVTCNAVPRLCTLRHDKPGYVKPGTVKPRHFTPHHITPSTPPTVFPLQNQDGIK